MPKLKIKKGDTVIVLTGRDKGKSGSVLRAFPTENKVVVQGVNIAKRHTRQSATAQGGIIEKEMPIHVSNVSHIDPKDNKPTRVGYKVAKDGSRERIAKRSGQVIG
jgi:large subunit ribosomal protein L24